MFLRLFGDLPPCQKFDYCYSLKMKLNIFWFFCTKRRYSYQPGLFYMGFSFLFLFLLLLLSPSPFYPYSGFSGRINWMEINCEFFHYCHLVDGHKLNRERERKIPAAAQQLMQGRYGSKKGENTSNSNSNNNHKKEF